MAEIVRRRTIWTASRAVAAVTDGRLAIVAYFLLTPLTAILALLNVRLLDQVIQQLRPVFLKIRDGVINVQSELGRFGAIKAVALVVALNNARAVTPQVEQLFQHLVHSFGSLVNVGNVMIDNIEHDGFRLLPGGVAKFLENVVDDGVVKSLESYGRRTMSSQNNI